MRIFWKALLIGQSITSLLRTLKGLRMLFLRQLQFLTVETKFFNIQY